MAGHRLSALLNPASVALVGASPRQGSFGNDMLKVLRAGGYAGRIHPVNPNYDEIDGLACVPSISALPEAPDLAVLGVGTARLEAAFEDAASAGARSAVIFDNGYLENDSHPKLLDRLKQRAKAAGIPVCGGNGMGFYNFDARCHVSFQAAPDRAAGHVALVAHSGSVFVLLAANDPRHRFNLIVSPGQEINGTVADYMDYALDQPTTRVVALFIETVRDPAAFVAALDKASRLGIPVVVLKVGRTEESARLAASHSAAIAGNDAAFEALFDHFGVLRVRTLDELLATAQLLAMPKRPGAGGLAAISDSGGLRELMIDLAKDRNVPFAQIGSETREGLAKRLPHGLEPVNPLDAAGPLSADFAEVFKDSLTALLADKDTALAAFEFEIRDDFAYMPEFIGIAEAAAAATDKPLFILNSLGGAQNKGVATKLLDSEIPTINGVDLALSAVRHALNFRDARQRPAMKPPEAPDHATIERWRRRLREGRAFDEAEGYSLLADFKIASAEYRVVESEGDAVEAAKELGFPLAMKTATPGIQHKSDVDGVRLKLDSFGAVLSAYRDLAGRLGPRILLQRMAGPGIELSFGMITDPQFGPLVMIGAGGTLVEALQDRCVTIPPVDRPAARRLIDRLRLRPLLSGFRNMPAADIIALEEAFARFSVLAATLAPDLAEIDVNPLVVMPSGVISVDALVVPAKV